MKNIIIAIVVVLVAVVGYMVMSKDQANAPVVSGSATPTVSASPTVSPSPTASPTPGVTTSPTVSPTKTPTPTASAVKTFNVTADNFEFSVKEMRVKKGDTVKVVFTNSEGNHDWVIDEFNARTPIISVGKTSTIQFVADKSGTFEYYCSIGTHRQTGMKGNLIVE